MAHLSTHILDLGLGKPAAGVPVTLFFGQYKNEQTTDWQECNQNITNSDGRITNLLAVDHVLTKGHYKIAFHLGAYFASQQINDPFFSEIEIQFTVENPTENYHVPLLLNRFGYSTYRGS